MMICTLILDEPTRRLMDYDHRRYRHVNGWSVRLRAAAVEQACAETGGAFEFELDEITN